MMGSGEGYEDSIWGEKWRLLVDRETAEKNQNVSLPTVGVLVFVDFSERSVCLKRTSIRENATA